MKEKPPTERCKRCGQYALPNEGMVCNPGANPNPVHDCGGIHVDWGPISDNDAREIYWFTVGL